MMKHARTPDREPEGFLPLRPVELQILVSLQAGDSHGYGILQTAQDRGEGGAVPGLVTLYRALQRMERKALVERADDATASADTADERRRVYRITSLGRRVLHAEALRLGPLVEAALRGGARGGGGDAA